jgi:peptidoglycan-N-acetylglucosamine deacetylase
MKKRRTSKTKFQIILLSICFGTFILVYNSIIVVRANKSKAEETSRDVGSINVQAVLYSDKKDSVEQVLPSKEVNEDIGRESKPAEQSTSSHVYNDKLDRELSYGSGDKQSNDSKVEQGEQSLPEKDNKSVLNEDKQSAKKKTAYLTFDDGPTRDNTIAVLDILAEEQIRATFFVIGSMAEKNPDILKRQKDEGHIIANHSYSHNYSHIYSSTENYLEDLRKADQIISSIIGEYNRELTRFPGGSFGRQAYIAAIEAAGYRHVDWNSLNGDSEGKVRSAAELINRFKETSINKDNLIVLMHDSPGKETTVQALPTLIKYLKGQGYEFGVL